MKKIFKVSGIIAMLAVLLLSFAACDLDLGALGLGGNTDANKGGSGTITITDIPSDYNGKYAMFWEINDSPSSRAFLFGAQSINVLTQFITLVRISNGKVSLPVWMGAADGFTVVRYSGSDTVMGAIGIFDSATVNVSNDQPVFIINFDSIKFSKGSARKSCSDAKDNSVIAGSGEGTLTVTDIPSDYDGMYAMFSGNYISSSPIAYVRLIGIQGFNASTRVNTFSLISDGKVDLPMWMLADDGITAVGYSGSDNVRGEIAIVDSETAKSNDDIQIVASRMFDSIPFSDGNATISWNDGDEDDDGYDSGGSDDDSSGSDVESGWNGGGGSSGD
jgi:hypothetical protein